MKILNLNKIRYEAFKNQNQESGVFDVTFDIGGKKLYSNKFMLVPVSTTFASMISERWTTKDQAISIETYCYDDIYQFFTFLYSGECQLTNDNIAVMVDMAEFFQVSDFKDYCDEYLSKLQCTLENVFQLAEIAAKYPMDKLKESLVPFLANNRAQILNPDLFLQISKETLLHILELDQSALSSGDVFEKVYEWAEKHAMAKNGSDSNLDETVKVILADFVPNFNFCKMNIRFVVKFVVGKSLIPVGPDLCSILLSSCDQGPTAFSVEITDENGRIMKSQICYSENVYEEIQRLKDACIGVNNAGEYIYWKTSRQYRPSHEIFKKRSGIEWYLMFDRDNDLAVKCRNQINDSKDFLISEMFVAGGFVLSKKCKIRAIRL